MRKRSRTLPLAAVISALLFVSCASCKNDGRLDQHHANVGNAFPVKPGIILFKKNDTLFLMADFKYQGSDTGGGARFLSSIDSAGVEISASDGLKAAARVDTILKSVWKTDSSRNSYATSLWFRIPVKKGYSTGESRIGLYAFSGGKKYSGEIMYQDSAMKSGAAIIAKKMKLVPDIQMSARRVTFKVEAFRLDSAANEYLPSSESFRVEVFDSKGRLVWNSNYQKSYMMVVCDVLPLDVGGHHSYALEWDKKSNFRKAVPPGPYKAVLSIPSLPLPYSTSVNFNLD